ncbi:hypothetical protein PTKIN_Ptkin08bG0056500 [Pterospermum kingtungense]
MDLMDQLFARMAVDGVDDGGLILEDFEVEVTVDEFRFCLVGLFLTDKYIHFTSMQNTLTALRKPVKGLCVRDLGSQCFLFQFFHELDIQRVESSGLWTFDRHVLISKCLDLSKQLLAVPLFHLSLWLQVHDLPVGFRSEKICKLIGEYKMKMKRAGGEWFWVSFQYERLPTFCFFCGVIGRSDQFCERLYDAPVSKLDFLYGLGTRASVGRSLNMDGACYLRMRGSSSMGGVLKGGVDKMVVDQQRDDKGGNKHGMESESRIKDGVHDTSLVSKVKDLVHGKEISKALNGDAVFETSDGVVILENKRRR